VSPGGTELDKNINYQVFIYNQSVFQPINAVFNVIGKYPSDSNWALWSLTLLSRREYHPFMIE